MTNQSLNPRWLFAGVACTTAATLMLQLTLTRIFSVIMYYHFAFLAISLCLFGLGASGIYLYLRPRLTDRAGLVQRLTRYGVLAGVTTAFALHYILGQTVSLELVGKNLKVLTTIYVLAALPFLFAGMVVTLVVHQLREQMSRVYFYDLVGAGLGCLALIPLLDLLGGPSTVLLAGALFMVAGVLFRLALPERALLSLGGGLAGLFAIAGLTAAVVNTVSPFMRIPSVKGTLEERVIFAKWNSFSRITVEQTTGDHLWLKMDSSAATRIFSKEVEAQKWEPTRRFSEVQVASLVYALRKPGKSLIVGPGGGPDVISALYYGQKDVTGVELNPITVNDVMKGRFREYTGGLYTRPEVKVVVGEGRSFIRGSKERYSSIQATLVDTWAATAAGAFTLSENMLYTREAFRDYLAHLTDDGVLTMTRWHGREFLRLLVLGRAALDGLGLSGHARHFYIAGDDRMGTFLLKKSPFSEEEVRRLDAYVAENRLTRVYSPFAPDQNQLASFLREPNWKGFVEYHPEDISPTPDDRPFFFYTVKPGDLLTVFRDIRALSEHNVGLALLLILLGVVGALVFVIFVLPLFLFRRDALRGDRLAKSRYLIYFLCLGAGYITVEIALMQHFVLFLGHPTYALVIILFSLLVASGAGSYTCRNVGPDRADRVVLRNVALLAGVLVGYMLLLPVVFDAAVGLPMPVRIGMTVALIAPLGLLMGTLLPLAIQGAGKRFGELVPWAWGLNGAASVFGSVLAIALAMNVGFKRTLLVGLFFYALGLVSVRGLLGRSQSVESAQGAPAESSPPVLQQ